MANSISKIALAGLGVTGIAGGVGASIHYSSQSKKETIDNTTKHSIISLLSSEGRQLLTKGQNTEKWKSLWTSFKEKYKTDPVTIPVAPWNFENWDSLKNEENAPNDFQDKCINNSKGDVESVNDELYQTIKTYCTAEKQSIKSILSSKRKSILEKTTGNKSKWDKNWGVFKADYATLNSPSWTFEEWETKYKSLDAAPEDFQNKCSKNSDEEVIDEHDKLYKEIVKYCVDGD
ncbi:hypothetical protein A6V39_01190 [Candidatus Mycoplasma haematobovis]|uniref:Uncharacterized protein n=1 Tax=Candidatus Mycoplasma haematobovis TaxID=432608 RepID=A0A1A9QEJ6_9MOLU|nr:hypothetical protein [Candidatus Mycoplasma haematobovis]OAL10668.1 hypothetical protein A6V39_01190 [Candidatus Mycoplasma haematobovis]